MRQIVKQAIKDHIWGPTGSVLLHILVVFLLVRFVSFIRESNMPNVEVRLMEVEAVDLDELQELKKEIEQLDLPDIDLDIDMMADVPEPEMIDTPQTFDEPVDVSQLDVLDEISSPLVMQGLFQGRSGSGRAGMLRRYGGSPAVEDAVSRALDWLKRHQKPNGSWDPQPTALTGLALLTFLAHGETPSSEKYGATVEKAIKYLIERQDGSGRFTGKDTHQSYDHGVASYAICEAFAMTRIPALKPVMDRAVRRIVNGQQSGGGWDYKFAKGARRDTSVSAWQAQALKAAYLAGSEVSGLREGMRRCVRDIKSVYDSSSRTFGYTGRSNGSLSTTGCGALSMQLLGSAASREVSGAVDYLSKRSCDWTKPDTKNALYAWYYMTQTVFHAGGGAWNTWNRKFSGTLLRAQAKDGHWDRPSEREHSQHNYGAVYNTTMCALTLQVYYRHLPTFQEKAIEAESFEDPSMDDILIEVL